MLSDAKNIHPAFCEEGDWGDLTVKKETINEPSGCGRNNERESAEGKTSSQ